MWAHTAFNLQDCVYALSVEVLAKNGTCLSYVLGTRTSNDVEKSKPHTVSDQADLRYTQSYSP